jgi:DNA-binding transcriptional ArsR family regulator
LPPLWEKGELCVCDAAWVLERAEHLVSHHLRALCEEGLVTSRREGKMVLYSLSSTGRCLLEATSAREAVA